MIYIDANVVIRLVEGTAAARAPLATRLAATRGVPRSLVTSRLTRLECRVKPLQRNDLVALAEFDGFLSEPELVVIEVTPDVIETATDLRAKYRFKTPDALHLATAILAGATSFLTGDAALARCTEIPVEVL